jgi:ABC-type antimicrobial peptide transport system permease subunit
VVIVSDRLARRFWPGRDPIGQRIRIARPNTPWLTVVGMVGDVSDSHDPGVPFETWYLPLAQHAATAAAEKFNLMVRTTSDPLALVPDAQRAVARVDPTLPAYSPAAMDRYRSDTLRRERSSAAFMLGFGAFGLALAALGVYGVVAFSIARRTSEIGLRIALGAQAGDIVPLVARGSAVLVGLGIVAGLAAAGAVDRVLAAVLADADTVDAAVLIGATALIALVSTIACVVPAVNAMRLDPIHALKTE